MTETPAERRARLNAQNREAYAEDRDNRREKMRVRYAAKKEPCPVCLTDVNKNYYSKHCETRRHKELAMMQEKVRELRGEEKE